MFSAPKLHHIDLLHGIGNELGALKRHYKSYIRLVDRVTEPQSSTLASRTGSRVPSKASQETFDKLAHQGGQSLMGIGLTSAALVRFERLRDMISLYALAECKDYLHQKDGLVQMVSVMCCPRCLPLLTCQTELPVGGHVAVCRSGSPYEGGAAHQQSNHLVPASDIPDRVRVGRPWSHILCQDILDRLCRCVDAELGAVDGLWSVEWNHGVLEFVPTIEEGLCQGQELEEEE